MGKNDDDRRNTSISPDFHHIDTEPFNDTSSPSSGEEEDVYGDNKCQYFEDTVPFDDEFDVELETQSMNLAGETQVLEIGGKTQKLDDFETQLLVEDSESDGTQILEDVDDEDEDDGVSCDDPQCRKSGQSSDQKEIANQSTCGDGDKKQTSSGSMPPRFTFLRAKNLREAALANRNMASKQSQDQICQEPLVVKDTEESFSGGSEKVREVDRECNNGKYNEEIEELENENMCNIASSAVRKLFNDGLAVEANEPSLSGNAYNEEDNLGKFPVYHEELERLSYVNSQEPGELSQINALDFVDRFLKDNIVECDEETNRVKNMERKPESMPRSSKGQQSLSKKINCRSNVTKAMIFDWDDSHEDEGGGDIYRRRKEDFFDGGTNRPRSLQGFQKTKLCRSNDDKEDEERLSIPNKRKTAVHSDSKLGVHNPKVRDNNIQEATRKWKRNLADELDEQVNANCSRGVMEPNANADEQELLDVGLDTQIAAEAMEALCNIGDIVDPVANVATRVTRSRSTFQLNDSSIGTMGPVESENQPGQYRKRKIDGKSDFQTSGLSKKCTKKVRQCKKDNITSRSKKSKLSEEGNQSSSANKNARIVPIADQRKSTGALKRHQFDELNNADSNDEGINVNQKQFEGEIFNFTPVARRTRHSLAVNQSTNCDKSTPGSSGHFDLDNNTNLCQHESTGALKRHQLDELNNPDSNDGGNTVNQKQFEGEIFNFTPVARRTRNSLAVNHSTNCDKSTPGSSDHFKLDDNTNLCQLEKMTPKENVVSACNGIPLNTLDCPRRRRSLRIINLSSHDKGSETLVDSSKPSGQAEDIEKSTAGKRKLRKGSSFKSHVNCQSHLSSHGGLGISTRGQKQRKILEPNLDKTNSGDTPSCCNVMDRKASNLNSNVKNNTDVPLSINNLKVTISDESPRSRHESSDLASTTPDNCMTPVNEASPVCMGDDYYKHSRNRNLSRPCLLKVFRKELHKELCSLSTTRPELITPSKDSRKRKGMTDVRILYSHHLDDDIVKHQKKILARLGVSVVSSIADATHFIADQFVRTRNMLEAIALGKPVVTHLWIESCGQANYFIDERNYVLRDAKKEKEFGFSMPVSLARASQHPLLKGQRVLITPNTKPSKEIISNLVMAVQGQAVGRVGRSALKDHKISDDLLILSCFEDYSSCVPFLEKGGMVYSSELLLNGIVTQNLEYQRYRLFADHVKKTRSTIWLKKDDRTFTPVTRCN